MKTADVVARALRQLPNLEKAQAGIEENPQSALRAVRTRDVQEGLGLEAADSGVALLQAGAQALKKVRAAGPKAKLTKAESLGLEAVIHAVGRPAIVVQDGTFADPPVGWEVLEEFRDGIETSLASVGRVDMFVKKKRHQIGTGFVVGKNTLMTNRHVAKMFAKKVDDEWTFFGGRTAAVDYRREKDRDGVVEFRIKNIIGVHEDKEVDLALFEIETKPVSGKHKLPPPLKITKKAPKAAEQVFAIGYPMVDNSGATPPEVLADIFGNDFGVKRLQPGEFDGALTKLVFSHDCSTLGGSSGSCVLSLTKNQVVGLHFKGTYEKRNEAVSLWKLQNDPLLKGRVEFV